MLNRLKDIDLGLITEIKSKMSDRINVPGFDVHSVNSHNLGIGEAGRVAIMIRKGIKYQTIDLDHYKNSFDIIGIKIIGDKQNINWICLYRRSNLIIHRGVWKDILRNVDSKEVIYITGDFNAHHINWNCENTDKMGENLLEEMEDSDMFVINNDTKSRMGEIGQRDSNLDLIFGNDRGLNVLEYEQSKDSWGSDHFPIHIECKMDYSQYQKGLTD